MPANSDKIGPWSEIKLDIIRKYCTAYSRILSSKKLHHVYIDAFAGAGVHVSKQSGKFIPGSPINALGVDPPFRDYVLIDLDGGKLDDLRARVPSQTNVRLFNSDCNDVLLNTIIPNLRYEDYRRGLCILDPYGLHLDWTVVHAAARMGTIELFINFPIMDINRNVGRRDTSKISDHNAERMTRFWGDETWRTITHTESKDLFGTRHDKAPNEAIVAAYRKRLVEVAGFKFVPKPMPFRNANAADLYYLFFAAHKPVAAKIVTDIFKKHSSAAF